MRKYIAAMIGMITLTFLIFISQMAYAIQTHQTNQPSQTGHANQTSQAIPIRVWTFNMAGHPQGSKANYTEFLQQVQPTELPDFIGAQEALKDIDQKFLTALKTRAKEAKGTQRNYQLVEGAMCGLSGPPPLPLSGSDEMCPIFYDSNLWARDTDAENSLSPTLYKNMQTQLQYNWGLQIAKLPLEQQNSVKQQLSNDQKENTFQLTLRVDAKPGNIGGPDKDVAGKDGPFSRIATWIIVNPKINNTIDKNSKVMVVNTHLCREMDSGLEPGQKQKIYQALVQDFINSYLSQYNNNNYKNVILTGDMNDNNCDKNLPNPAVQPQAKWQVGVGHIEKVDKPYIDWIFFYSSDGKTLTSSSFKCIHTAAGNLSDHGCAKEATLNFSPSPH